jgi:hypothetical protein
MPKGTMWLQGKRQERGVPDSLGKWSNCVCWFWGEVGECVPG